MGTTAYSHVLSDQDVSTDALPACLASGPLMGAPTPITLPSALGDTVTPNMEPSTLL
jgi:hypothetical protein